MLGLPAQLIGFAGTALVVASLTPDPAAQSWSDYLFAAPSSKGDKLQVAVSKTEPGQRSHDRAGSVAERASFCGTSRATSSSGPTRSTNTTSIAKNVEFPGLHFEREERPPCRRSPRRRVRPKASSRRGRQAQAEGPSGCEGVRQPARQGSEDESRARACASSCAERSPALAECGQWLTVGFVRLPPGSGRRWRGCVKKSRDASSVDVCSQGSGGPHRAFGPAIETGSVVSDRSASSPIILGQLFIQYRLNVWNRDIFNALEQKDISLVGWLAMLFVPLAVAAVAFNVASVWGRLTTQRAWRAWLTDHLIDRWLKKGRYYQLNLVRGRAREP